jgi:hypothetical protein
MYLVDENTSWKNVLVQDVDEQMYQHDEFDDKNKIRFHINEKKTVDLKLIHDG